MSYLAIVVSRSIANRALAPPSDETRAVATLADGGAADMAPGAGASNIMAFWVMRYAGAGADDDRDRNLSPPR